MSSDGNESSLLLPHGKSPDPLCGKCKTISEISDGSVIQHHNLMELGKSAGDGCPCCQLFVDVIGPLRQVEFIDPDTTETRGRCSAVRTTSNHRVIYRVRNASKMGRDMEFSFEFCQKYHASPSLSWSLGSFQYLRFLSNNPEAEALFNMIAGWIEECRQGHARCHQNPTPLPKRILDVANNPPTLENSMGGVGEYIILSHCWGNRQTLTTTRATVAERRSGIPLEVFPKTFQDVVIITRKLGIVYLWIDSLCIVQDDIEDWTSEAGRMQNYYRRSYLTISALDSTDSQCGILNTRKRKAVLLSHDSQLYMRPRSAKIREIFAQAPLNKRAWALQERLLSTRIVHYSKEEIFWECLTCSARECYPGCQSTNQVSSELLVHSEGHDFKRFLWDLDHNTKSHDSTLHFWYRLVKQYTQRDVTYHLDRLPAISGVASLVQTLTGLTYLSGLWREDVAGLLWAPESQTCRSIKPCEERMKQNTCLVPSWSWASSTVPVHYELLKTWDYDIRKAEEATISHFGLTHLEPCTDNTAAVEDIALRAPTVDVTRDEPGVAFHFVTETNHIEGNGKILFRRIYLDMDGVEHEYISTSFSQRIYLDINGKRQQEEMEISDLLAKKVRLAWITPRHGIAVRLRRDDPRPCNQRWQRLGITEKSDSLLAR